MTDRHRKPLSDDALDSLFDAARLERRSRADPEPVLDAGLLDAILRAADEAQPGRQHLSLDPPKRGVVREMRAALGGWLGLGGLALASAAGLLIGVVQPESATMMSAVLVFETLSADPVYGFDAILEEG